MVDPTLFREAMSRLGAAVCLITTDGNAGRGGFTASAVCSVTDGPPTMLVCMKRTVRSHDTFLANRALCVNVLSGSHQSLSGSFADSSVSMEERFRGPDWTSGSTGLPLLASAVVAFECQIADATEVGTHTVLFCTVAAAHFGEAAEDALLYCGRAYHRLPFAKQVGRA